MPEITIYRKVVDLGTDRERAVYAIAQRNGYLPFARLVGDFEVNNQNESTRIVVNGRPYGLGQLSPVRCLGLNLRLYSANAPPSNYTHGYYLVRNIEASADPVIAFEEGNFTSSATPEGFPEEKACPLTDTEKEDFLSRCENRTDFAIVEVAGIALPKETDYQSYQVLLHDRLTLPLTMGG